MSLASQVFTQLVMVEVEVLELDMASAEETVKHPVLSTPDPSSVF